MPRLTILGLLLIACTLTACNPFSKKVDENQFVLKREQLVFMGHKLGHWEEQAFPQCVLCSLSIYTIKVSPAVMLFKQINDERGDLAFLAARNVSYSFALNTGVSSYPVTLQISENETQIVVDNQPAFTLVVNQKKNMLVGGHRYFIELKQIDSEYGAVDLNIWSEGIIPIPLK